jgi:hypothetical protein
MVQCRRSLSQLSSLAMNVRRMATRRLGCQNRSAAVNLPSRRYAWMLPSAMILTALVLAIWMSK